MLDINLLRSPKHPDPKADQAVHEFTYSLFAHSGNHLAGGVIRAGYELNVPLQVFAVKNRTGKLPANFSFVSVDAENIIIESIKKAEDNNDIILRLYEAHGSTITASVKFGFAFKSVCLTNMLEEKIRTLEKDMNKYIYPL